MTIEKGRADLDVVAAGIQASSPEVYRPTDGYRLTATPLREELTRDFKTTLLVLLGASRTRLLRQLLTESLSLALIGGALGIALAAWGVDLLVAYAARVTPRATDIGIDRAVLLYTFLISIATGLVFGAIPALAGPLGMAPTLRDGGRTTQNRIVSRLSVGAR